MRATHVPRMAIVGIVTLLCCGPGNAELQNVEVGGELRIRDSYWTSSFNPVNGPGLVRPEVRYPARLFWRRPIGDLYGRQRPVSYFDWDSKRSDYHVIEQRTRLNLTADFTDHVNAFVEFDSYDFWGTDMRSNYLTGADGRTSPTDVEIHQAYIESSEMFGTPLRLRVGRQELVFGSGWLVGNNNRVAEFPGLSFDAVRLTYGTDTYSVDVFTAKLAERSFVEEDGDIDFSGIYASCAALEDMVFDLYWLWVRDARDIEDVRGGPLVTAIERFFGVDDYPTTNLHTIGGRVAGQLNAIDFEAEAAYQFGDAAQVGRLFRPGLYGDDDADFGAWAAHVEAGYSFDMAWQPRVHLRAAYIGGEDNRDLSFAEWLNPFTRPESSVSFNRLFSDRVYSVFFDELAQASNFWTIGAGIDLTPCDAVELRLSAAYFAAIEKFDLPKRIRVGRFFLPIAGSWTFWTDQASGDLGWDVNLSATYHYSEDLEFEAGWSHLFTGDGLAEGNYIDFNGLLFSGGLDDDDADYFYAETRLRF